MDGSVGCSLAEKKGMISKVSSPGGSFYHCTPGIFLATWDIIFEINKSLNKEIFVFIWHRWHDSNSEHPLKKIDEEEFANHVNKIVNFKKYNGHINGVVWWGADRYFYNVKHKSILEEKLPFNTFDDYFNSVFKTYMPIIIGEINKANI